MCYTLIWVAPQKFIIAFVPLREVEGRKLFLLSQNKNKEDNMKTQSFNEIENLIKEYSMIPICKEIYAAELKLTELRTEKKLKKL